MMRCNLGFAEKSPDFLGGVWGGFSRRRTGVQAMSSRKSLRSPPVILVLEAKTLPMTGL